MPTPQMRSWVDRFLVAASMVVALILIGLTFRLFGSTGMSVRSDTLATKATVPPYDYPAWYGLPVQQGRIKPFQSACMEAVRQITGRERFAGLDPVAVTLAWMFGDGANAFTDWENYPCILCEYHELRRRIFEHLSENREETGRHVAPAVLRQSPGFDRLLEQVAQRRQEFGAKAHFYLSSEELRAEEVGRRLVLFDAIRGRTSTRLFANVLIGEKFIGLRDLAAASESTPEQALERLEGKLRQSVDPLFVVGLDRVPGSGWFSRADLRDPLAWRDRIEQRQAEMPELYFSAEHLRRIDEFQGRVRQGHGPELLEELRTLLANRRQERLDQFAAADKAGEAGRANALFHQIVRTPNDRERMRHMRERLGPGTVEPTILRKSMREEMAAILGEADDRTIRRLESALEALRGFAAGTPEFRMLQLEYLEARFPDSYRSSAAVPPFPTEEVSKVLEAFDGVRRAYRGGVSETFDAKSQHLFRVLRQATDGATIDGLAERQNSAEIQAAYEAVQSARQFHSGDAIDEANGAFFTVARKAGVTIEPYPGVSTIPLELRFNAMQPFRWAWVLMLTATLVFLMSYALPGRSWYVAGFALASASLAVQAWGFYARIALSGWMPVSNMYETVVFAAFMAASFGFALELIYRRRVIGVAGAAVATFGLILADQLPLALDPKISPLLPILRTNYWLTIHVLTIVCGYGAGTLAWGLGNLSLALLALGRDGKDGVKTLARLTYRAMQLTVLLLATGTFLGGWWAAEAWGRFWGWDPKEVGALIALICYVIPLHARYIGVVKDFGLAVAAVACFGAIVVSWYVINFVLAAGLHSYGFGVGGAPWVLWATLLNAEWVLLASLLYRRRLSSEPRTA